MLAWLTLRGFSAHGCVFQTKKELEFGYFSAFRTSAIILGPKLQHKMLPSSGWMYGLYQGTVSLSVCKHIAAVWPRPFFVLSCCLWLLSVCKEGAQAIEAHTVLSGSQAAAGHVGELLWCPFCYLVPINKKSCAHMTPEVSASYHLHIFLLPPCSGSNMHPWKALGRSRAHTQKGLSFALVLYPSNPLTCLQMNRSSEPGKATQQVLCLSNLCLHLGCEPLGLSGALPKQSCYFLNLLCRLCKRWVVVTLQKSPPSLTATGGVGHLPIVESWEPGCLSLPHLLDVALLVRIQESHAFLYFLEQLRFIPVMMVQK